MPWKIFRQKVTLAKSALPVLLFALAASFVVVAMPSAASAASVSTFADSTTCPTAGHPNGNGTQCFVDAYINPLINTISALIGIITVISIVIAGIQYTTSADDPSKVQAAKARINRSLLAFLAFIFLYAILQWLTPGGLFNG